MGGYNEGFSFSQGQGGNTNKSYLVEEFRMREAKKIVERFERQFERMSTLPYSEIRRMITWGPFSTSNILDEDIKWALLRDLKEAEHNGKKLVEHEGFEDKLRLLISRALQEATKDNPDALGAMAGACIDDPDPWIYNPEFLVRNFDEGTFSMISGPPGGGKTNLACVMIEELIKKGFVCMGNIKMIKPMSNELPASIEDVNRPVVEGFTPVFNSQQYADAIKHALKMDKRWVMVFDDTMNYWFKTKAISNENVAQDQFTTVVRHYKGNLVLISQREQAVSTTVQDFVRNWFVCPGPEKSGNVRIGLGGPNITLHRDVKGVPLTVLPYDTHARGLDVFFEVTMSAKQLIYKIVGN